MNAILRMCAVACTMILAASCIGGPRTDGSSSHAANSNDGEKVVMCHIPPGNPENAHEIEISENAVPAHLGHGDFEGPCDATVVCPCWEEGLGPLVGAALENEYTLVCDDRTVFGTQQVFSIVTDPQPSNAFISSSRSVADPPLSPANFCQRKDPAGVGWGDFGSVFDLAPEVADQCRADVAAVCAELGLLE